MREEREGWHKIGVSPFISLFLTFLFLFPSPLPPFRRPVNPRKRKAEENEESMRFISHVSSLMTWDRRRAERETREVIQRDDISVSSSPSLSLSLTNRSFRSIQGKEKRDEKVSETDGSTCWSNRNGDSSCSASKPSQEDDWNRLELRLLSCAVLITGFTTCLLANDSHWSRWALSHAYGHQAMGR